MERTLNLTGYKCQALSYTAQGVPLVFLHGLSFTTSIWQRIGIPNLLVIKHVPFLALDMPYGLKTSCRPRTRNPETNVSFLAEAIQSVFGSAVPALVGASLGGYIALRYAAKFPVKGLFLVSPSSSLAEDLVESYLKFRLPVRIIWGSDDNIISEEEMRTLADKIPNAKLLIYNNASHAAYLDKPQLFKRDLLEFYANVVQT